MTFTPEQIGHLEAKLSPTAVKEREQSGRKLSYIEGWHAIAEANRIFGFDAWNRETLDIRCVAEFPRKIGRPPNQRDGHGVSYVVRVRVTIGIIVREGVGAGHGIDVDLGLAHESAIKEAETDAMKRALMTFGNPFGLALYDKSQANVAATPAPANDRASAAEQKRALTEIDVELLDCASVLAVDKCAEGWRHIAKRDGWSRDYIDEAAAKFKHRREYLANQPDAADRPNSYLNAMQAG